MAVGDLGPATGDLLAYPFQSSGLPLQSFFHDPTGRSASHPAKHPPNRMKDLHASLHPADSAPWWEITHPASENCSEASE